ncbi:uncharacterized protein LOC135479194 isoform X2 [Liolophura sinensis]
MWKSGLVTLLALAVSCNCLQYVRRQTFKSEDGVSGRTSLKIDVQIPGKIQWKSDSSNTLQFRVTSRATEPQELDNVRVSLDSSADTVLLTVKSVQKQPSFAAHGAVNGAIGLYVTSLPLIATVLITTMWPSGSGGRWGNVVALLLIWLVRDPGGSLVDTRLLVDKDAAVTVLVPEAFVFQAVSLRVADGEIEVDPALTHTRTPLECFASATRQTATSDSGNNSRVSLGCDFCCSGRGVCDETNSCQCHEGYSGPGCEHQEYTKYKVYINPADTRLLSTQTSDGEVIHLYGKRSSDGSVRSLNALKVRQTDERQTSVTLGKRYRVKRITSSTGSRLNLKWLRRNRIYVKAVTPDGSSQVNIDVRLKNQRSGKKKGNVRKRRRKRRETSEVGVGHLRGDFPFDRRMLTETRSQYLHIPVRVASCEVPEPLAEVFANVYLNYQNGTWDGSVEYRAMRTRTPGVFFIQIPNNPASRAKDSLAKACSSIGKAALRSCASVSPRVQVYEEKICNATANGFAFIPNADPRQVQDVLETCRAGFKAVESHCKTIDFTPEQQDDAFLDCDNVQSYEDSYTDKPIFVSPVVVYPDGRILNGKGAEIRITRNMVYHEEGFVLDDNGGGVKLTDIVVDPSDPKPKERYTVRVTHRCASNKTSLYASVAGSDFYTNEMSCIGYKSCNCCELGVAGAAELVVDSVQVHIEDPHLKTPISRHVVVIF